MSALVWILAGIALASLLAVPVVSRILGHRIQAAEAALAADEAALQAREATFTRDFGAAVDEELPRFLDEESE